MRPHDTLFSTYEEALSRHGDTAAGALWPNEADRNKRFEVMLDVIREPAGTQLTVCDLGCGTGELVGALQRRALSGVRYIGIDRSATAIAYGRQKFPEAEFVVADASDEAFDASRFACDYLVSSGLFTFRDRMPAAEMWAFLERTVRGFWPYVRRGMAFNVMSKAVDWERDDLFHVPMDDLARLLHGVAGRRVVFRADYGLYEYTAYAYRESEPTPAVKNVAAPARIPVMRPQLPSAGEVLPYLERIDANRWYSNHGPLVLEFEQGISRALGMETGAFVSASSGTAAIAGAILATAGRARNERPLAFMPAFTFVGTPIAAQQAGFEPYLVDCDEQSWAMTPELVLASPALARCGVVVVVAPFGRRIDFDAWSAFERATEIPVVIDGAASFDGLAHRRVAFGSIPIALSFHATKAFGIGEGGGVVCADADRRERIAQALNFGFAGRRESTAPSINGKLSEYHAAVGLAELASWPRKHERFLAVADTYRRAAAEHGIETRLWTSPEISCGYVVYRASGTPAVSAIGRAFDEHGIETRLWYGCGVQKNATFAELRRDDLTATERIAPLLIGLPIAPDLDAATIERIVEVLAGADAAN